MTDLFAVTTGFPAPSAAMISVRAGSIPPISSTMTSVSGSAMTWAGASVSRSAVSPSPAAPGHIPDGDRGDRQRRAVGGDEAVRVVQQAVEDGLPTVPAPSTATRSGGRLIGWRS